MGSVPTLDRPGCSPGRFRIWLIAAILVACVSSAATSFAHDLFSWWSRGILSVSLTPGDWVRIASEELSDGDVYVDTLLCRVLEPQDGSVRYVEVASSAHSDRWIASVDLAVLQDGDDVVDALLSLYRLDADGGLIQESVEELQDSQLLRGRLADPFQDPILTRSALPDTMSLGPEEKLVERERVILREEREMKVPLGRGELNIRIELESVAHLSEAVPVFGLLESWSSSVESSERRDADGRAMGPPATPQRIARHIRCISFGHGEAQPLPPALRSE
jgi:hypothetical protein